MSRPACRFCGGVVTSTNPESTICRGCYYAGRHLEECDLAPFVAELRALPHVAAVAYEHTGGNCWALLVTATTGRVVMLTQDGDPSLPEVGSPVDIALYTDNEAWGVEDAIASSWSTPWADARATVARFVGEAA